VEIFVVDASAVMSVKREVRERVEKGLCLICDCQASKRGLCDKHVNAYYHTRRGMSKKEQAAFDARLIRAGKLLPAHDKTYTHRGIFERYAKG